MFDDLKPHLVELRKRLGISVAAVIIMFFVAFNFHEPIMSWMTAPLNDALAEVAKVSKNASQGMVTTSQVGGTFFVAMKVAFFTGLLAALPIVLAQLWLFVAPGLYENEKKDVSPLCHRRNNNVCPWSTLRLLCGHSVRVQLLNRIRSIRICPLN
jgi:sec-independent protein translocase protein TatC